MANLNKVFLIGRLVADPELSHTQGGTPYIRFRIAVNNPYKDKNGDWQDDTVFIDVVVWGDYADTLVQKLSKATQVLVEGRLRQSNWETESGEKRSKIEVVANKVSVLSQPEKQEEEADIEW
jgi:single-strand DNA-binding protein